MALPARLRCVSLAVFLGGVLSMSGCGGDGPGAPERLPDLVVDSTLLWGGLYQTPWSTAGIEATVLNRGEDTAELAEKNWLRVRWSPGPDLDLSDDLVAELSVWTPPATIRAGEAVVAPVGPWTPDDMGWWFYVVEVDPDNLIKESDETNNLYLAPQPFCVGSGENGPPCDGPVPPGP